MDLTRNEKRNTKEEIFFAAAELFSENGYMGVSMKDIAKKASIKAASIYNHYSSKEEIMDTLLDHYLGRMEAFYTRLAGIDIDIEDPADLGTALNKLMLGYEPGEMQLMYWLTRIVHHEQFHNQKAGDVLIGSGYRKYVTAHTHFFDRLSDMGLIYGRANNRYYGELYARLSLTFATQFLHPEFEPTISDQAVLSDFVNKLVMAHERQLRDPGK